MDIYKLLIKKEYSAFENIHVNTVITNQAVMGLVAVSWR